MTHPHRREETPAQQPSLYDRLGGVYPGVEATSSASFRSLLRRAHDYNVK
jgi:hypothetical protein